MTEIKLERFAYHPKGTLGAIRFDRQTFFTIEKPWKNNAVMVSCIPEGVYDMGWRKSPKFGETWHVQDVPNRTHILIHTANFPQDVHGCIGLGTAPMSDAIAVGSSREAVKNFEALTKDLEWQLVITYARYAGLTNL